MQHSGEVAATVSSAPVPIENGKEYHLDETGKTSDTPSGRSGGDTHRHRSVTPPGRTAGDTHRRRLVSRHNVATSRKQKWAPQSDREMIQYNFDLRRKYCDGDSDLIPEEVERAKILIARDERKRKRKLGKGGNKTVGAVVFRVEPALVARDVGVNDSGFKDDERKGVRVSHTVVDKERQQLSSNAIAVGQKDTVIDTKDDQKEKRPKPPSSSNQPSERDERKREKKERKKKKERREGRQLDVGSEQEIEKEETSGDIETVDKEQQQLPSNICAIEQKDVMMIGNASDNQKEKRLKPSSLSDQPNERNERDERKRQKKERKNRKKEKEEKEVDVGTEKVIESEEASGDVDEKERYKAIPVVVQKRKSKEPVKASSTSKHSKAKYSKLKRDRIRLYESSIRRRLEKG